MYKTRLQEFCQRRHWLMPEYNTTKHGLDHCPQFGASVIVNGLSFATNSGLKSSKEAQNTVAKLAYEHLLQAQANQTAGTSSAVKNDRSKDLQQLYKNQLQEYAQKINLALPEYASEREGPPHVCRFKCKVTIHGKTYETTEFFTTLKEAENAAAKVAVSSLLPNGVNKNLLQDFAQKGGHLPTYCTKSSGNFHPPTFISNVKVGGKVFPGMEASTKKQAEMNAAKVAYMTLTEDCEHDHQPSLEGEAIRTDCKGIPVVPDSVKAKKCRHYCHGWIGDSDCDSDDVIDLPPEPLPEHIIRLLVGTDLEHLI